MPDKTPTEHRAAARRHLRNLIKSLEAGDCATELIARLTAHINAAILQAEADDAARIAEGLEP